jgi:hypothetical protein
VESQYPQAGSSRDPRVGFCEAKYAASLRNLRLTLIVLRPAAAAEEVRPWLGGVGLLLSHVADYRELEHLSLISLHEQEDPQDKLGQTDQRP